MQDEFRKLLKNYPLIASKNPDLALLTDTDHLNLKVRQSSLYRKLWNQQRQKLARYSTDIPMRKLIEPADRFRDQTRTHPIETKDTIDWPTIDFSNLFNDIKVRKLRAECRVVMDTPKQAEQLVDLFVEFGIQLAGALGKPCPVFEDRYAIRVEFLGCLAWVALKIERQIRIEVKDSEGSWQLSSLRFDLLQPMHLPTWLGQFLLPRVDRLVLTFGETAEIAYDWLRASLESFFHTDITLQGIRQQIRQQLCVDREMLEAGKIIKRQTGGSQSLMNTEVSDLWPAADLWAELYQKYPGLLLLCHLAGRSETAKPLHQFDQVRSFCLSRGLSPAGWRFLIREGDASYISVVKSGLTGPQSFFTAIKFIEWQSQARLQHALPGQLAVALINFAASSVLNRIDLAEQIDPRFARIALDRYLSLSDDAERKAFIENECLELLIWMRNVRPVFDKNQWKSGWAAIMRKFETPFNIQYSKDEWLSEVAEITISRMHVMPLTTAKALCLEGIVMKNCISTYTRLCRAGTYRVFSIRETTQDNHLATAGLVLKNDVWQLDQVKGKFNRKVDAEITAIAESLTRCYQQAVSCSEARSAGISGPQEQTHREVRHAGFFQVKVSNRSQLLCRNSDGRWTSADANEYPISAELRAALNKGVRGQAGHHSSRVAELAIRLRLELPAGYSVYLWDEIERRDRLLTLN